MSYQKLAPRSMGLRFPRILHTRSAASVALVATLSMFFSLASAQPNIPSLNWTERSDWINVKTDLATNAVGDGSVDDTDALQEALDKFNQFIEVGGVNQPKVVYLPPGTYRITDTLVWPSSVGCSLIGHGRDTTIIWDGDPDSTMLRSNGGSQSRFDGITWDADNSNSIAVNHSSDARFEASPSHYNSAFLNASVGIQGNYANGAEVASSEMLIENCLFENCGTGIDMSKNFNFYNQVIVRCEFRDNDYGVQFGAGYGYVRFCHFENTTNFDIQGTKRATARYCTSLNSGAFYRADVGTTTSPGVIQNCVISGWSDTHAVYVSQNSLVFDNVFENPPPGDEAPVYFSRGEAIVSENVSAGTTFLYETAPNEGAPTEVPAGNRTRVPLNATDSFLITEREVPTVIFDVVAYGAIPNDGLDDTDKIQDAIDAAAAHGRGAIAYFPAGRYSLASTVNISGADYVIGGTGIQSDFQWIAATGGVLFEIKTPYNIHVEHLGFEVGQLKDGCTAIKQIDEGWSFEAPYANSSITYTGLVMPQQTKATNDEARLREGLHIKDLSSSSSVYFGRVNGRMRIENSAQGIVTGEFLNGNHTKIDGIDFDSTPGGYITGFTGWGSMNGHDLVVDDNLSLVVGDLNFEQSALSEKIGIRSIKLLKGDATNIIERKVTVGAIKTNLFDSAQYFEIDDYEGQFSYLHGTANTELGRKFVELYHEGTSPIDLFIGATDTDFTAMPILVDADTSLTLTTFANWHQRPLLNEWYASDGTGASWVASTVALDPNDLDFALEFDGVDDFLLGSIEGQFGNSNTALTAMAWVNPSALGQDAHLMGYMKVRDSSTRFAWYLRVNSDNTLEFIVNDKDPNPNPNPDPHFSSGNSSTLASVGTWMHVAGVWDGNTVKLYINGVLEKTAPAAFTVLNQNSEHRLVIGGSHGNDQKLDRFYAGALDEVRVYNEALSDSTILTHYNSNSNTGSFGTAGETGLVAGWHFNEGGNNINSFDYNDPDGLHLLHYEIDTDHNPANALTIAANALDHFRELGDHLEDFNVGLPASPIALTATAVSDNQIDLSWTDTSSNEDGFEIKSVHPGWTPENVNTYSYYGLQPGTEYSFSVRAVNSAGASFPSNEVSATTFAYQPPPILTWNLSMWATGDWDHSTLNWNPGPVAFSDGDEVHFDQNEIEVNLIGTLRPAKIISTGYGNNRWLFTGSGIIADALSGPPTSIEISNGFRKVNAMGNHSFSGGILINSGGQLVLETAGSTADQFGSGPITLDDGTLCVLNSTVWMNSIIIESGGGSLNTGTNDFINYLGPIELNGDVTLGMFEWDRTRLYGPMTLTTDVSIIGGNTHTSSQFETLIASTVVGPHVVTMNVTGLGMRIESYLTNYWDINGLTKTGPGVLLIKSQNVCGDTLRIDSGIIELDANQTVSDLYLGGVQQTALGTYGSSSSGATYQNDTYFSGTSVVTLQ